MIRFLQLMGSTQKIRFLLALLAPSTFKTLVLISRSGYPFLLISDCNHMPKIINHTLTLRISI